MKEKSGSNKMVKKMMARFDKIDELTIALMAYQMWEKAGYPTGQDMEFWLQAEGQLCALAHESPRFPPAPSSN